MLLAGVTVGAILGLLAATPILHWLGGRRAIVGALLLIAGAMTAMALALIVVSVPLLAAAFVLVGFGIGLLDVLINVAGAAVERTVGRTVMPLMHAAWSIGAAVGAGIGAACAAGDLRRGPGVLANIHELSIACPYAQGPRHGRSR
jgi:predicted MFS family arabinose efflux permease